jgi:hypothetical protein
MFNISREDVVTKNDKLLYNVCELLKENNDLLRSMRKDAEEKPRVKAEDLFKPEKKTKKTTQKGGRKDVGSNKRTV